MSTAAENYYRMITGVEEESVEESKKAITVRIDMNTYCKIEALCSVGNLNRGDCIKMLADLGVESLFEVSDDGFKETFRNALSEAQAKFYEVSK